MGLEFVAEINGYRAAADPHDSAPGQGQPGQARPIGHQSSDGGSSSTLIDDLAEAERLVAATRERLAALADRAAELRRQLGGQSERAGQGTVRSSST